jgi:hypothetical protein
MTRLSLWKDGQHSNDYKFMDRRISEMFTIGGTGVLLNKYLGVNPQGVQLATSMAQPAIGTQITFSNTVGINVKDFVYGTGVPAGARAVAV